MNDPRRWTDEGGESTALERELVGAGRDAGPSREQKRKMWGAIAGQAAVAATGAGAASASGTAAAATGLTVLKATAIVVLVGAGVVATTRAMRTPAVPTPQSAAPTAALPSPQSPQSTDDRPPATSASTAPVADPGPAGPRSVKVAHPAPRPNAAATAALADNARASQLREESAMILEARSVLRGGDPARAFTLLDAARARFPAGILVQEREALTIEALVRAGQRALARKRADAFLRDYPKIPHAADVRSVVAEP
jgi:hypothetical protein